MQEYKSMNTSTKNIQTLSITNSSLVASGYALFSSKNELTSTCKKSERKPHNQDAQSIIKIIKLK